MRVSLVYYIIESIKPYKKAIKAMETKVNIQGMRLIHLEDPLVMCGVYTAETLEKLVQTVLQIAYYNSKWKIIHRWIKYSFYLLHKLNGIHAINSLLYLRTLREKYVKMYEEFILQLCLYYKAIWILANGYFPISPIIPSKLQEILNAVQMEISKTTPVYDLVIKRPHLYYDMNLVTFNIDRDSIW